MNLEKYFGVIFLGWIIFVVGLISFGVWVIIKLLSHFGVI